MTVVRPDLPSKYNPELVERAVVEEVFNRHPERLTIGELSQRIAGDPDDDSEIETITQAIAELRCSGLVRYRNGDQIVEPTHAALRFVALMQWP